MIEIVCRQTSRGQSWIVPVSRGKHFTRTRWGARFWVWRHNRTMPFSDLSWEIAQ